MWDSLPPRHTTHSLTGQGTGQNSQHGARKIKLSLSVHNMHIHIMMIALFFLFKLSHYLAMCVHILLHVQTAARRLNCPNKL